MKNIAVIGTGYVGLVTGTCFADLGNRVVCIDMMRRKIETLCSGGVPIYEPGLAEVVQRNVGSGRLHFTTSYAEGLRTRSLYSLPSAPLLGLMAKPTCSMCAWRPRPLRRRWITP